MDVRRVRRALRRRAGTIRSRRRARPRFPLPSCPLCGARAPRVLGANPDFRGSFVLKCKRCTLMWSNPAPDERSLDKLYEASYGLHHHDALPERYLPEKDARAEAQRDFVLRHSAVGALDDARVLEIGCGIGSFLAAFEALPNVRHVVGVEPSPVMCERARERLPNADVHVGSFSAELFAGPEFDVISGSHVLEHVGDPSAFLASLRQLVRPGGVLFLEVPNETERSVRDIIDARHQGLMHLVFFNPASLAATLERGGWKVLHMSAYGPDRRAISAVPADRLPPVARTRAQLTRWAARVQDAREIALDDFSLENDPNGIWLRVVAAS